MKINAKTILSYVFSFLLAFFIFSISILTTLKLCVFNADSITTTMEKANYFSQSASRVNTMLQDNVRPTGIPPSIFQNYVSEMDIRDDMIEYVQNAMRAKPEFINVEKIKSRMNQDIQSYLGEQNISEDEDTKEAISLLVNQCIEEYKYITQFPFATQIGSFSRLYNSVFWMIGAFLVIGIGLMIFLIKKLHRSRRRTRKFYAYACVGSGLMLAVMSLYLYGTNFFGKINISPQHLYSTITLMTSRSLLVLMVLGIIFIMLGILLIFLKIKRKMNKNFDEGVDISRFIPEEND